MPPLAALLRAALADALAFVLPVSCAGCGAPDAPVCSSCRTLLATPDGVRQTIGAGMTVHSAFVYDAEVARMLRAFKADGRTGLARPLGAALGVHAASVCAGGSVMFVPVPTSAAAMRRRGYRVVDLLLRRSALPTLPALRAARGIADQRRLGRDARARNVVGSLVASPRAHGREVVIVDDVVTTGSTLLEAQRALTAVGAVVRGGLTVAATPKRTIGA
jgi:predicted amidophosphoribosyltransferase